jgi:hypothetical protein
MDWALLSWQPENAISKGTMTTSKPITRWSAVAWLLVATLPLPVAAQYVPPHPGSCGSGFTYSAGVCVPRGGGGNAYQPPRPGSCATGFTYSAGMCVPRAGGATNAYRPPRPGSCATGYTYSASMCVPRR